MARITYETDLNCISCRRGEGFVDIEANAKIVLANDATASDELLLSVKKDEQPHDDLLAVSRIVPRIRSQRVLACP